VNRFRAELPVTTPGAEPAPASSSLQQRSVPTVPDTPLPVSPEEEQLAPPANRQGGIPFGNYVLIEELAQGGMGVVYRAYDTVLRRTVALKRLLAGLFARPEEVERFHREARAVAGLEHEHIITIYEVGQHEGHHYFTMPFATGGSLARQPQPLEAEGPAAVVALVEKVARAVHHAHEHGILHRDLKPGNILLDDRGEPLVTDFGLAKFLADDVELTRTGERPGTPAYMAPEQFAGGPGAVTERSDVWALGVLLYELLTQQRPFEGSSREELTRRVLDTEPPRPRALRPELDRGLEKIVLNCLAKAPEQRYQTAAALADDLRRWRQGELRGAAPSPARAWWALLVLFGAIGTGAVLLARLADRPENKPVQPPPVTLLGPTGAPAASDWKLGQADAVTGLGGPEGAFSIASKVPCLLELCPVPPWTSYRLEASIRHDENYRSGQVGLYFGYSQHTNATGTYHCYCQVAFADRGLARGDVDLLLRYQKPPGPGASASNSVVTHRKSFPFDPADRTPGPWRRIVVEVKPGLIRAECDGVLIGELPRDRFAKAAQSVFDGLPAIHPELVPQGGIGLAVAQGKASFRNVVVKPLP